MTAVEWLVQEINKLTGLTIAIDEPCVEQAKEMEKQQIIEAHYDGKGNGIDISHPLSNTKEISAEQYYNETFKNTK